MSGYLALEIMTFTRSIERLLRPGSAESLLEKGLSGSPLGRARELKSQLADAIGRLKPAGEDSFGDTDEWRFYNALFYPYVLGLRPYSRRTLLTDLPPEARKALTWFKSEVPERTQHTWQNAAANLIAQHLKETL